MVMMPEAALSLDGQCGDYRILRLLGSGGYADVFKAKHAVTGEVVALKRLKQQHVSNARAKERFLAEARLFAKIQHANVVRVLHVGSDRGALWMAMEYLDGGSLRDALKAAGESLPIVQALYIAREIADGVAALHEMRVVHRDLKPENIMVTREGAVKVLDAGAAKFFGWEVQSTGPLGAVGTPLYMAPEHILGDPVDARTDVYALGLILYEMLAGRHAFARDPSRQASQLDIIAWQLHAEPPPLADVSPIVSAALSEIVGRAIAKKPHERFGSMPELAKALRAEWKLCVEAGQRAPQIRLPEVSRPNDEITTEPGQKGAPEDAPTRREPRMDAVDVASDGASLGDETVTVPVRSRKASSPGTSGAEQDGGEGAESSTIPLPVRSSFGGTEPLWAGRRVDPGERSRTEDAGSVGWESTPMTAALRRVPQEEREPASREKEPAGRENRRLRRAVVVLLLSALVSMGVALSLVLGVLGARVLMAPGTVAGSGESAPTVAPPLPAQAPREEAGATGGGPAGEGLLEATPKAESKEIVPAGKPVETARAGGLASGAPKVAMPRSTAAKAGGAQPAKAFGGPSGGTSSKRTTPSKPKAEPVFVFE